MTEPSRKGLPDDLSIDLNALDNLVDRSLDTAGFGRLCDGFERALEETVKKAFVEALAAGGSADAKLEEIWTRDQAIRIEYRIREKACSRLLALINDYPES